MDSISNATNFFINQGLGSDEAKRLVSKGMEAYTQQIQPQSMMQMASNGGRIGFSEGGLSEYELLKLKELGYNVRKEGPETFGGISVLKDILKTNKLADGGIARLGYQMGGVSTMPMDYGQSLQVPQQMPTNFSSAQNITMNPLLNYGQTPLSMNRGGIARLGYQMGGEAMMQPQGMQQEEGMGQLGEGDNALLTIIQLLIEQGVDPQTAEKLARQILQIFAQGGEPALDQFIGQLEQQEQTEAMAAGGIAGYGYRQGYGFGSFVSGILGGAVSAVKGVANAVKSVAKSKIGKIALTVAAGYFLGPAGGMFGGAGLGASLTTNAFLAGAINAGAANLLVQGVTTGKFNPKEALLAGVLGGATGYMSPGTVGIDPVTGQAMTSSASNITSNAVTDITASPVSSASTAQALSPVDAGAAMYTDYSTIAPNAAQVNAANASTYTGLESDIRGMTGKDTFSLDRATLDPAAGKGSQIYNPGAETKTGFFQDTLNKAQTGIQNLYKDPIGTIKGIGTAALDYTQKEPGTALALAAGAGSLATLGAQLGMPRSEGEDDISYEKRLQEAQGYITQYGRNLQIRDPYFYQREGAVNPFAPTMAAQGGIMGYRRGGSMVPPARQIEGGVIELDARKTGGYIPYGKKERVDDVPAMLAKDEFVFTSRAVKAAGNGSAKRGAAKMYAIMKQLEGARA